MRLSLIFVESDQKNWILEALAFYEKRLKGIFPGRVDRYQVRAGKVGSIGEKQKREAKGILQYWGRRGRLILMDQQGLCPTGSDHFARLLKLNLERDSELTLVIGGAYGFSDDLQREAHDKWSLSPLLFCHGLAQIVLCEQIYRACAIWSHHPYHHG